LPGTCGSEEVLEIDGDKEGSGVGKAHESRESQVGEEFGRMMMLMLMLMRKMARTMLWCETVLGIVWCAHTHNKKIF
jgi:hypothetical protein